MKKITLLFVMTLGIFASCVPYPEENPDPIPPASSMFLQKTIRTNLDESTTEDVYIYSGSKIIKVESSDGKRKVYTYNELDLISKIELFDGTSLVETDDYVYDISKNLINLIKINEATSTGTKWAYVHNANGTISYQKFSGDDTNQTDLKATGVFSATKIVETVTDPVTSEEIVNTTSFTYDLRKNPFINVIGYNKIYFADLDVSLNSSNNIISQTTQLNDAATTIDYTNEYITYTDNGFPFKMEVKQGGVWVSTVNFFY